MSENDGASPMPSSRIPTWRGEITAIAFYAVCLLLLAFVRDTRLQPELLVKMPEFLRDLTANDPRTFAGAAVELQQHGWLTPASEWIFRLWPPGFVLLEAAVFKVFGEDAPFLLVLLVVAIAVGVGMLMTVRTYLGLLVSNTWATALPLIPFLFPVTRFFILQPLGLAFGEGFSVMFFVTGVFMLLHAMQDGSIRRSMAAGVFLAFSAYFRSQYELIVSCMTVGAVFMGGILFFLDRNGKLKSARLFQSFAIVAVTSMLVAHASMLPWRIHNYRDSGRWSWVHTQELVARNSLASEKKLIEVGGSFVISGGGHLACKFEPSYCDSADNSLFYKAFANNLGAWYGYKASILGDFWFPRVKNFPKISSDGGGRDLLGNSIVLATMLVGLICLISLRRRKSFPVYCWIFASFYGCFFVVFSLVQFEVRYFYLPKIFALFMGIALLCEFVAVRQRTRGPQARSGGKLSRQLGKVSQ